MDIVLERLNALEKKIRDTVAELTQARGEREALHTRLHALQDDLTAREHEVASLRAEREREAAEAARLRAEREEVRAKVEGLLEEIARLETAVQGTAT